MPSELRPRPVSSLSYDLRAPSFGAPIGQLYQAALEQVAWADEVGLDAVMVNEHHGSADGYLPSPLVFASAIAARTRRLRIWISALVLPLHDPIAAAEDLAVLDLVSAGRVTLVVVAGYRRAEFEMFGADFERRARAADDGIAVLRQAWTGEPFEYRGRMVTVTPRPVQQPSIPVVLGGSSPGSARRAARWADGYRPSRVDLVATYRDELTRLGRGEPLVAPSLAAEPALFVSHDPEAMWEIVAPHAVHDTNSYAEWTATQPGVSRHSSTADAVAVRATGNYLVLTPQQCIEHVRAGNSLNLKPLLGGLDPTTSWESLRLIEAEVLPALR